MSFQALARTWRPRRFDELVGQAHVVRALTHALEQDKLHHALLFSGTRGVGKTTLARIIAKCLNCEYGTSAHPCRGDEGCATCREIDEGRFVDLIEVDAASRTGVDDTRELMDNVQYAPTRGRTKVYLIDEVHMLSKHSFNALLKTLEEPPPRVQFLLATTEPEKIPVTILSRCLQFPLKRLPVAEIAAQLRHIVDAESITAEEQALVEVARAADGSMRDGLSLLDQAIAFSGGALEAEPVRDMLGTIGQGRVVELVEAIVDARAPAALEALAALYAQGIDMRYLLEALATAWQQIATIHVVGEATDESSQIWEAVAGRADPANVHLFYDIALAGVRDLAHAPDPLVGVKMSVLRMLAFAPAGTDVGTAAPPQQSSAPPQPTQPEVQAKPQSAQTPASGIAQVRAQLNGSAKKATPAPADRKPDEKPQPAEPQPHVDDAGQARAPAAEPTAAPAPTVAEHEAAPPHAQTTAHGTAPDARDDTGPIDTTEPPAAAISQPATVDERSAPVVPSQPEPEPEPEAASNMGADEWHTLVERLSLGGFAAQLAHNGICRRLDENQIVLALARSNEFLATPNNKDALQQALASEWAPKEAPRVVIEYVDEARDTPAQRIEEDAQARQQAAIASIENDPFVKQLRERLGAQLRAETIKPHRNKDAMPNRDEL
ncbi:DNA polymerase III subunits gamma and tau [Salinisphaera sp. S4-8]|uniref:DNA polymerase III subunit gamma/tau n=1 Tax=Salinisphaera sp. S4-8 TaxID=633357 RepID=UPI00333F504B